MKKPPKALVAKWEVKLGNYGLGLSQIEWKPKGYAPVGKNSRTPPRFDPYSFYVPERLESTKVLRKVMNLEDSRMFTNIVKPRGRFRSQDAPDWVFDDRKLRRLILFLFPRAMECPEQQKQARRCIAELIWYYRLNYTAREIGEHFGKSERAIRLSLLRSRRKGNKMFEGGC
jgi:hypothetical protein